MDIKPDHVAQLVGELRVVGELELLDPVRLEAMRAPDALDGTAANADGFRHHRSYPVSRLDGRIGSSERDDTSAISGPSGGMREGRVLSHGGRHDRPA